MLALTTSVTSVKKVELRLNVQSLILNDCRTSPREREGGDRKEELGGLAGASPHRDLPQVKLMSS